jgi:protein ImuA
MAPATRQAILEDLRERIRRIERRPSHREGFLPSGRPEVDALLPGGGFPRGAISHLAGGPASGKTGLALEILAAALREGGLAAFVDGRGELYPPAAESLGIDLERMLVVRVTGDAATGLWAAEAILASGAFAAAAIDVPASGLPAARAEAMLRRVQMAAEKGGAVGLWLGPAEGGRVPAVVRLDLAGARRPERIRARGRAGPGGGHAA